MAGYLRHIFESAKSDGGDATLVRPSNWNAHHGRVPPSPGSGFDGFDTTDASDPLSGWTTLGTVTAADINTTLPSCYYLSSASASGITGHYKAWAPASDGHYCSMFMNENNLGPNGLQMGLWIAASGGASTQIYGGVGRYGQNFDDRLIVYKFSNRTTFSSEIYGGGSLGGPWHGPIALRFLFHSSTSVDFQVSQEGGIWKQIVNFNPGFTIAHAGMSMEAASAAGLMGVDWFDLED